MPPVPRIRFMTPAGEPGRGLSLYILVGVYWQQLSEICAPKIVARATVGRLVMSLGLILVLVIIIFLVGGFSGRFGGYGYGFGHGGIGVLGLILIVLVVLLFMGRL